MESCATKERRQHIRVPTTMRVNVRTGAMASPGTSQSRSSSGQLVNLGDGGAACVLDELLPISRIVAFQIDPTPYAVDPIELEAQVVWRNPSTRCHGLCFPTLNDAELSYLRKIVHAVARKTYAFETVVYLADTNAEGNVYFARYFEWQGRAREEFLRRLVPNGLNFLVSRGIRLMTVEATIHYKKELWLFDAVQIRVKPTNVKHTSVDLEFTYVKKETSEEIATGKQTIAFSDQSGRLVHIPIEILENGRWYLDADEFWKLTDTMARNK